MSESDDEMSNPIVDDELEPFEEKSAPVPANEPVTQQKQIPVPEDTGLAAKAKKAAGFIPNDIMNLRSPFAFNMLVVLISVFIMNSPQVIGCFGEYGNKLQNPYIKTIITAILFGAITIGYAKFTKK